MSEKNYWIGIPCMICADLANTRAATVYGKALFVCENCDTDEKLEKWYNKND